MRMGNRRAMAKERISSCSRGPKLQLGRTMGTASGLQTIKRIQQRAGAE